MALLNLNALLEAPVQKSPFDHCIVPDFIKREALEGVFTDFPKIDHGGSYPLSSLEYGKAFGELTSELLDETTRDAFSSRLGIDLEGRPATLTVRGRARKKDGKIHVDSKTKLITVLLYLNPGWAAEEGRLRLLHSPDNIEDVVLEVTPIAGMMVAFRCTDNAWHGHKPFEGERRAIQLNWVVDQAAARRSQRRHGFSSLLKRFNPLRRENRRLPAAG